MKEYVNHYYYKDENKECEDNDYIGIEAYETSLTYLMYLVEKAKNNPAKTLFDEEDEINISRFYTELVNSINVMLNLVGEDYIQSDSIKIVMLVTY